MCFNGQNTLPARKVAEMTHIPIAKRILTALALALMLAVLAGCASQGPASSSSSGSEPSGSGGPSPGEFSASCLSGSSGSEPGGSNALGLSGSSGSKPSDSNDPGSSGSKSSDSNAPDLSGSSTSDSSGSSTPSASGSSAPDPSNSDASDSRNSNSSGSSASSQSGKRERVYYLDGDETFVLYLDYSAGTGYEWECSADPDSVLTVSEPQTEDMAKGEPIDGGPLRDSVVVSSKNPGKATVTCKLVRSWEDSPAAETQTFVFEVDEDLQMKFIRQESNFVNEPVDIADS